MDRFNVKIRDSRCSTC